MKTAKEFIESIEGLGAIKIRELVLSEYADFSKLNMFTHWLNDRWMKYDGKPDHQSLEVLEESINCALKEIENQQKEGV